MSNVNQFQRRLLSMLLITSAALLTACGGGGSMGSSTAASSSSTTSTAQSCSNCGTALVSLTDAPGDFVNYIVNVVSLQLTRSDGTVVQTVPASTQVDFAQLVNLSEIISAGQIPSGQYVSAKITLDYSGATIVVNNGTTGVPITNIINGATGKPLVSPNSQVTLTLTLDSNNQLFVTQGAIANLALDFNLAASNTITPSDTAPTTVTVNPVLSGSLVPDASKQLRVRGPFVSADTMASSFIINVRPFFNSSGTFGQLTVGTTTTTTYSINGTSYTGSAGLTELATLTAGTMIVAYGTWDTTSKSFTASNVLAGSSVPGVDHDSLSGTVVARSGNTLTVANGFCERMQPAGMAFYKQTTVTVGSATTVTEQGQSGSFTIADISVGQHIQAMGTFSAASLSSSTPALDATAGGVQLVPTTLSGSVSMQATSTVTLNLQSIDGFAASAFNFAGTGTTSAQDATASAYTVALIPGLTTSPLSANSPAQFIGFVAPFGAAPPDFNAMTSVSYANTSAQLWVSWMTGYAMPFTTLSSTELVIGPTALKASTQEVIRIGFETSNPSTLAGGLTIQPDMSATNPYFVIGHITSWKLESFTTFGDFVAALMTDLGTTDVIQLSARGPYTATTGMLSADDIEVLLND
ncbi:MAG: DUF4382 domain-containing protein [Steroidobacteraceae bacterium]